jgi:hypothetical protein
MNFEFPPQIFENFSIINFYENPFSEPEIFHEDRRRADSRREREGLKLIVCFRNCVNAPKSGDFFEAGKYDVDSKII